jgi:FlaA1/EpsC-like NDP-sugar epimerase
MNKHFKRLAILILSLPRLVKRLFALFTDLILCALTVYIAYYLQLGEFVILSGDVLLAITASIVIALPIFIVSGLYRAIFRYSEWPALVAVARAICIYAVVYGIIFTAIGVAGVPRTVGIIQPLLLLLFVCVSRTFVKLWLGDQYLYILKRGVRSAVLIYGAGKAGRQLVDALRYSSEMKVVGFLDDDNRLHGNILNGQLVYNPADLVNLVSSLKISQIFLAIPSLSRKRRNEILSQIRSVHVAVRTLPSFTDLAQGVVNISDLQELDIDDLLGREPIVPNPTLLAINVYGKVVMVTGAGGSIGSELSRQIVAIGPSRLLLIEQNEYALYTIHQALQERLRGCDITLIPLLASVQDSQRMQEIITTWHPDTIYHAAAYKHVPLVEHNPTEGIKNNVFGTLCLAKAAVASGVSHFVLISTDKAVRPTNIMGASKRLAETLLQAIADNHSTTRFSIVRFGNVLDSSGSVVPKFRQQIRNGGPISLTHPEVTRYFMTIPEAAQLVIQAAAMAKSGDVFLLDMGESVKITDLAKRMIELSGLTVKDEQNPDGDIEIQITGLRPGEKLYEELLIGNNPKPTAHSRIMKANEDFIPWPQLEVQLNILETALNMNDTVVIRSMMQELVAGYTPSNKIVDWVYLEQEVKVGALDLLG